MIGSAAAGVLVALILVSYITMRIADFIIDSRVRRAGPDAGVCIWRGPVAFCWSSSPCCSSTGLWPPQKQPEWVVTAKSKPMLDSLGNATDQHVAR